MTYIVTERCVGSRYTECVADCPVDCFYELQDPHMLIINPDECIDCDACVPLCPVNAIYPEAEVPDEHAEWVEKNDASLCTDDNRITDTLAELDGALTIDEVRQKEEEKFGYALTDPSGAAH
ncbi:ferredoxin family protein [Acidobacteria bacterium AH-259-G07]|nr:ferredoxin family protein [Acidobacteria bacterium AH-259-G07]